MASTGCSCGEFQSVGDGFGLDTVRQAERELAIDMANPVESVEYNLGLFSTV